MDIIIPCAGLSTRFANMRPKYLLTDYQGKRMIELVAENYIDHHRLHVVILQEHDQAYQSSKIISKLLNHRVNIITLPARTRGPADTIYQALTSSDLKCEDGFLVRDCDSLFSHPVLTSGNKVFVCKLMEYPTLRTPANKSYVNTNDQGIITSIIEKTIVSDTFCVGGYQFESAARFISSYQKLASNASNEIYLSSIIDTMLSDGDIFFAEQANGFNDLGTKEDWAIYNNHPTIFCDIDGTIIKNQSTVGSNSYDTKAVVLNNNVNKLKQAKIRGCQIIFTTSRPETYRLVTQQLLDDLGFSGCTLLMGLYHSRRILINDYAASNPYPSAVALNLKRDADDLDDLLDF